MGLFGKKTAEVIPEQPVVAQKVGTVIGEGMTFVGDFTTEEEFEIQGRVEGNINSPAEVIVAKSGTHKGVINAQTVRIEGSVDSTVNCSDKAVLVSDSNFNGTLNTVCLEAARGSNFAGTLNMSEKTKEPAATIDLSEEDDVPVTEEDIFGKL